MYRKLTQPEIDIFTTLKNRKKIAKGIVASPDSIKVKYIQQDKHTTLAVVKTRKDELVGASKFNPNDTKLGLAFNKSVGEFRAFVKALTN